MAKKSVIISEEVAELIKARRQELGLTIESAAKKPELAQRRGADMRRVNQ